ncbi:MAG: DNA topoisomerase [Phycisphaerales bacterium]|nr:DNA topoisomerase [Phycisphaerales bacterium]
MSKNLVIVESPAKAKTISKYLGSDFVVEASVGHVRDLPRSAKGEPVPGVDLNNDFQPTYVVTPDAKKVISNLKKLAKAADTVWFATDLDREGEAIAWHLAECLGVDPEHAQRVKFNAITKKEIGRAFDEPLNIDLDRVNAQQTRRIVDRIVGYQVSPLLWKRVARGLSAGRVQSVAVRMVVEREREIRAFVPDEFWQVTGRFTADAEKASELGDQWQQFMAERDERDKGPSKKRQTQWLAENSGITGSLHEVDGKRFDLRMTADGFESRGKGDQTHQDQIIDLANRIGLKDPTLDITPDPEGKGPATRLIKVAGDLDPATRYQVTAVERKQSRSRPHAPFITTSLQAAAANTLGFTASRTMGAAQQLYQGVALPGEGQIGLITYMRTDSTHLSPEAMEGARSYILENCGKEYLPEKPNQYSTSNRDAQEAHEAIRPTDPSRHPDSLPSTVKEELRKLYGLIWRQFISSQMVHAVWDRTDVKLQRSDKDTGVIFRCSGRTLVFDGFYRITGTPSSEREQTLPQMEEGQIYAPFAMEPDQRFTTPPSRYNEASLVKNLEAEGIGRPSTYASIIDVIQKRGYVEKLERAFHPTDIGEVVTDKLIEAFPQLMDLGYTRMMEADLDRIATGDANWIATLHEFYKPFADALEHALENMSHARAEITPADYACPECGARTAYRLGRNGKFLSCSTYPDCDFATTIDRKGKPLLQQTVDVACSEGSDMVLRNGRFGPFIASVQYPEVKYVVNLDKNGGIKYPSIPPLKTELPCGKCDRTLNLRNGKRGPWLGCSGFPKCRGRGKWKELEDEVREDLEKQLAAHEKANPQHIPTRRDGSVIEEGTASSELLMPGQEADLDIHPEAAAEKAQQQDPHAA